MHNLNRLDSLLMKPAALNKFYVEGFKAFKVEEKKYLKVF